MCGYHVAAFDEPLMDHTFEAWDYGPVVPVLYGQFKRFRNQPITTFASEHDWDTGEYTPVPIPIGDARLDKVYISLSVILVVSPYLGKLYPETP